MPYPWSAGNVLTATDLNSALAAKTDIAMTQNAQTGTSYSFALADASKLLTMSNAAANTVTVTKQATVSWVTATQLRVMNLGAGVTTLVADTGVTINNNKALGQYQGGTLIRTATDVWLFVPTAALPSSATATVATSQTTTSGTYTDLATTGPAVTLTTGTKALVIVMAELNPASQQFSYMSAAVSGASTVAASDAWAIYIAMVSGGIYSRQSSAKLFTGLTAGLNTFTAKYRTANGSTGGFLNREIIAVDMGS